MSPRGRFINLLTSSLLNRLFSYLIDGPCSNVRLLRLLLIPIHMHLYLSDFSNMLIPATPLALACFNLNKAMAHDCGCRSVAHSTVTSTVLGASD